MIVSFWKSGILVHDIQCWCESLSDLKMTEQKSNPYRFQKIEALYKHYAKVDLKQL